MEFLEDLIPRLRALNPWVLWGPMLASVGLMFASRIIRRRRMLAELAPSFGLQPIVEGASPSGWIEPGITGAFCGQPVRLTLRQTGYGRQPGFRVNVFLRLRVSPLLSADLQAERERGGRHMVRSFNNLPVERVGDEALDQALDFNVLGPGDPEVLRLPEIRRTLIELVEASDAARFADGELQLRVTTGFNASRYAEMLLTGAQAFAEALTSDEARAMRADGPVATPRSA